MDNGITEYRVRLLKFDDNYCDKTQAVDEKRESLRKKTSSQGKNCIKVNKQPETSQAYRIVSRQTSYRTETESPDHQVEKKSVKQAQLHWHHPINQKKPRSTVDHFPAKRKIFTSVGVGIVEV